jgi:hypothetical protein
MTFGKKIIVTLLVVIACLVAGCSLAGVKNNYEKSGPIERKTTPSSYRKAKIRVENIQPAAEDLLEKENAKSVLVIRKVGDKEYIITVQEKD